MEGCCGRYHSRSYIGEIDWLPDGRLVFARDNAMGSPLVTFSEEQGLPRQLAVSPDGQRLAFTLATDTHFSYTRGTTWVVDIDGQNLHQLTDLPIDNDPSTTVDDPVINWPTSARQLVSYYNMTLGHDNPEMVLETDFSDEGGFVWLP